MTLSLGAALLALGPAPVLAQIPGAGVEFPPPEAAPPAPPPPPPEPLPPPPAPLPPPPPPPPVPQAERPPPQPRTSSWQLDGTLLGRGYSLGYTSGVGVAGDLQVTRYLAPVVDDDAPRSLQPFLQRASVLYADVGGSGFLTWNPGGGENRTDAQVGATLGLDIYVLRQLALTAAFGYGYDVLQDFGVDDATHSFSGSAGLGLRFGDVRIDASYTFFANDTNGSFAPLRWGEVNLAVFAVIDRVLTVRPWGELIQQGGGGGVDLGAYPTRNFGVFLSGFALHGQLYMDDTLVNRYGGSAGVSYWVAPRVRVGAYYQLTVNVGPLQADGTGDTELDQAGVLQAEVRLP